MTNAEIIARVTAWQGAGFVHELTCGVDSLHEALIAIEVEGGVVLHCPTCGYRQKHIPPVCLSNYVEAQRVGLKKLGLILSILCASLLLTGCKISIELDTADMFHKPEPKPVVETRDAWLDVTGRQLAQEHGWTLTFLGYDENTPTVCLYHLTRSLLPLPAEKP